ncbi:hypothetical protein KOR42_45600 [Thalassoglobus neptunius]|uniref:Uncharacterized protein n=1 Tax=Thalassoglobus neptunius TaxID=1938619 RepID=A0A5C5VX90_9PLAN|nr:hypothetical protein [Thalassoglobus neptunius]TWT43030.1 hypothetical protein KOR42_45600 [Thalassoglobus neptunius]
MKSPRKSPILKSNQVRLEEQPVCLSESTLEDHSSIILKRRGELITSIEVTCTCGKVTILDCAYEQQESLT